jgi:ABC-type sugar transport system substrate-binding protein
VTAPITKRFAAVLLSVAIAASCATTIGAQAATPAKPSIVIISPFYSTQPTTKEVVDRFVAGAKAKGWLLRVIDTKGDDARTNAELRAAAGRKPAAIVLGMGDWMRAWLMGSPQTSPPTTRCWVSEPHQQ